MQDAPDRGVLGFLMHTLDEYLSENDVKSRFFFGRLSMFQFWFY